MRDGVPAFNADGPSGLIDRKAPGNPPKLDAAQRRALAADGSGRLTHPRFGVSLDESTLGRMVKQTGFRKLTVRLRHHEQDPAALAGFKKTSPPP